MKGMKKNKAPSTKDRIRELEIALQNSQMAMQMSQGMIKHLVDQFQVFQKDLGSTMGMLNDFQYRNLALIELTNINLDDLDAKAEEFKLADFNKASDQEDIDKNYLNDDQGVITEDSIVILSSNTPDLEEDKGIFRSKFPMAECLTPDLREKLLGAKVGDVIESDIYGVNHKINILGLRKVEIKEEEVVNESGE